MSTVQSIKDSVNVEKLSSSIVYEDVPVNEIRNIETEVTIAMMLKKSSKETSFKISYSVTNYSFEITNENVIILLNELKDLSKSTFVKSVLETVLTSNKFSQKQLDIIVSEIVKFENLTLNF